MAWNSESPFSRLRPFGCVCVCMCLPCWKINVCKMLVIRSITSTCYDAYVIVVLGLFISNRLIFSLLILPYFSSFYLSSLETLPLFLSISPRQNVNIDAKPDKSFGNKNTHTHTHNENIEIAACRLGGSIWALKKRQPRIYQDERRGALVIFSNLLSIQNFQLCKIEPKITTEKQFVLNIMQMCSFNS